MVSISTRQMYQRTGTEPNLGSCQNHRKGDPGPGTSAHMGQASTTAAAALLRLHLEDVEGVRGGHPLERVPLPTPLNHVPDRIRDFRMDRPRWSVVLEHREDHGGLGPSGKWGFSGEDLRPTPTGEHPTLERHEASRLTSQASIPNANMSVALVVRAWTSPNASGSTSSGAIP
jgi:hypothetical protein